MVQNRQAAVEVLKTLPAMTLRRRDMAESAVQAWPARTKKRTRRPLIEKNQAVRRSSGLFAAWPDTAAALCSGRGLPTCCPACFSLCQILPCAKPGMSGCWVLSLSHWLSGRQPLAADLQPADAFKNSAGATCATAQERKKYGHKNARPDIPPAAAERTSGLSTAAACQGHLLLQSPAWHRRGWNLNSADSAAFAAPRAVRWHSGAGLATPVQHDFSLTVCRRHGRLHWLLRRGHVQARRATVRRCIEQAALSVSCCRRLRWQSCQPPQQWPVP